MKLVLDRLLKIDFLSRVVVPLDFRLEPCTLVKVPSWREAVSLRGSDIASDAFSEASGLLTRKLSAEFRKEYGKWNDIARENRQLMEERLFARVDQRIGEISELEAIDAGPELVRASIRWDLLHFASEQAYSELVAPAFYSRILEIYEAGHFPCNWDKKWPNGKLWAL